MVARTHSTIVLIRLEISYLSRPSKRDVLSLRGKSARHSKELNTLSGEVKLIKEQGH